MQELLEQIILQYEANPNECILLDDTKCKPRDLFMIRKLLYENVKRYTLNKGVSLISTCGNKFCINPKHLKLKGIRVHY